MKINKSSSWVLDVFASEYKKEMQTKSDVVQGCLGYATKSKCVAFLTFNAMLIAAIKGEWLIAALLFLSLTQLCIVLSRGGLALLLLRNYLSIGSAAVNRKEECQRKGVYFFNEAMADSSLYSGVKELELNAYKALLWRSNRALLLNNVLVMVLLSLFICALSLVLGFGFEGIKGTGVLLAVVGLCVTFAIKLNILYLDKRLSKRLTSLAIYDENNRICES